MQKNLKTFFNLKYILSILLQINHISKNYYNLKIDKNKIKCFNNLKILLKINENLYLIFKNVI